MVVSVVLGSALFLGVTVLLRASIQGKSDSLEGAVQAKLGAEDGLFEVERQVSSLHRRLAKWRSEAYSVSGVAQGLEPFWQTLQANTDLRPDETLALVSPTGEMLAAVGPLASDPRELNSLLRIRALVGRTGSAGLRSGMVLPGPEPTIGVSVPVHEVSAGEGNPVGSLPGASPRVVLISSFESRGGRMRDDDIALTFYPLHGDGLPPELAHVPAKLWRQNGMFEEPSDDGARSFRAVEDASERPTFLLVAQARQPVSGVFGPAMGDSLIWEVLAILVTLLLSVRFVNRDILKPLLGMERHASRLARTEHGRLEFHSREDGEIGALARSLDEMLHKIQADRSEFVRSARIAGMSDVSMGVVHSAGNILNSVNVSTKLLAKELGEIGISDLRAMIAELKDHQDDLATYVTEDPNGKFLLPFLFATTEALDDLRTRCLVELESVEHGVGHVIDLIRSQEKYAIGAAVVESTSIEAVIDQALNIATLAGEDASEIHIERSYSRIGEVFIDRHKLTSILINIISNAVEALNSADVKEKRLELALYPMTDDRFVIEVMDTGVGIAPENLDLIFTAAFSTKKNSSGQGLHTTANLCKELGIAIGTVSEGEGFGSVFKLRVPYSPPDGIQEAGRAVEPGSGAHGQTVAGGAEGSGQALAGQGPSSAGTPGSATDGTALEDPAPALPSDSEGGSGQISEERSWSSHSERGDLYRDNSYRDRKPF
ncbi:Sensor protein ZraS [Planctomycetes bacterium Poly30]|uniref:histidine kinase n=2 Tax=Saltatorellus ferox TaxID=2528018 RepID=A0A518EQI3_9BACT|nr:Sensor protein ZraS [Planctomycetes bacterium Poly30]